MILKEIELFIEKLIFGYQPNKFSNFEILFSLFIILIVFYFFKKTKELKLTYLGIFLFYLFLLSSFYINNLNYEGSDRVGNCGWLQLEEESFVNQSAYKLQANRFIQNEKYITDLKVSFYYPPPYILIYKYFCSFDNSFFNAIILIIYIFYIFLTSKLLNENIKLILLLNFTGFSSYLWMLRQGQLVVIELIFLLIGFYLIKEQKYILGSFFVILFGLSRVYFLILLLPIVYIRKSKKEFFAIFIFFMFLIATQIDLWLDYFYLWFGEDGYLFGDVTSYSNRTSLFDEHLGRYAFSVFLVIRFLINFFSAVIWSSNEFTSILLFLVLVILMNIIILKITNKLPEFQRIIMISMGNFVFYPVLKPYILLIYILLTIFLFQYKNSEYIFFTIFIFSILGLYGHIVTNIISSTFTMEIYQLLLLALHFMLSFSKKFDKNLNRS